MAKLKLQHRVSTQLVRNRFFNAACLFACLTAGSSLSAVGQTPAGVLSTTQVDVGVFYMPNHSPSPDADTGNQWNALDRFGTAYANPANSRLKDALDADYKGTNYTAYLEARSPHAVLLGSKDKIWVGGWYDDREQEAIDKQLKVMNDYAAVDFVVFNWYANGGTASSYETPILNFLRSEKRGKIKFALQWSNHDDKLRANNTASWASLSRYWVKYFFMRDEYKTVDGKPVLFIFSYEQFFKTAKAILLDSNSGIPGASRQIIEAGEKPGSSAQEKDNANSQVRRLINVSLFGYLRGQARAAGFPDVHIVLQAGADANNHWSMIAEQAGFDGLYAYNYHCAPTNSGVNCGQKENPYSHSYAELDRFYRDHWDKVIKGIVNNNDRKLTYFVPVTAGWDSLPRDVGNGSYGRYTEEARAHNKSRPTDVSEFVSHLKAGHTVILDKKNQEVTKGIGLVCCWNEYSEGSIIEPTVSDKGAYLSAVQNHFRKAW
jgi:hypothetical protein